MIVGTLDKRTFSAIGEEAAFQKNRGMANASENRVASAANSAIASACVFDDGGVNRRCERDVSGVIIITGLFAEVRGLEAAAIVSDSFGREGEGFDSLSTATTTRVEVERDEDRIGEFVREVDSLLQGQVLVVAASETDFEATLAKLSGKFVGEIESMIFFAAVAMRTAGAGIVPAVARVDDDGVDTTGVTTDIVGAHNRIEKFDEVDAMDEIAATRMSDGEGEDEFDGVHPDVLLTNEKFDSDVAFFQNEFRAGSA